MTSDNTTLTLDLEVAGNLTITLNDFLGQEIYSVYNAFIFINIFFRNIATSHILH
jgi:hypothetical protein